MDTDTDALWIMTDGWLAPSAPDAHQLVAHIPAGPLDALCGAPGFAAPLPAEGRFEVCARCLDLAGD